MALVFAAPAAAGGPSLVVGAAEDSPKQATLDGAKTHMTMAKLAGLKAIRVTTLWRPGLTEPPAAELTALKNAAAAGNLAGIRLVVSVYPFGSSVTPLTPEARTQFARFTAAVASAGFRELIIGNEPNINRFWLPQFAPDGSNAAATAFLPLLAATYDAVKAAEPRAFVWGIGLSPRGSDNPALSRPTHSPTAFIRDLGTAYRASGRTTPIMDGLAIHPYGDNSSQAPKDSAHPNSTTIGLADYAKLVALLGTAFDGTAQAGSTLPLLYDEYGVEAQIPAAKERQYDGTEPATTRPVDESTQASFYRQAIELTFCQPNVRGIFLFHVSDEQERVAWQSGLYAIDGTPRVARDVVRNAADQARRGIVARCNLQLVPRVGLRRLPDPAAVRLRFSSNLDGAYRVRLVREDGTAAGSTSGRVVGGTQKVVRLRLPRVRTGLFRLEVTVRSLANPAPPQPVLSSPFRIR
jgi:hypothetical protein